MSYDNLPVAMRTTPAQAPYSPTPAGNAARILATYPGLQWCPKPKSYWLLGDVKMGDVEMAPIYVAMLRSMPIATDPPTQEGLAAVLWRKRSLDVSMFAATLTALRALVALQ